MRLYAYDRNDSNDGSGVGQWVLSSTSFLSYEERAQHEHP